MASTAKETHQERKEDQPARTGSAHEEKSGMPQNVGKFEMDNSDGRGKEGLSLDEISQYRAQAQQNSIDAIMGARQRYTKAKGSGA